MQSINKIHVNSSTILSLNERFTIMQTNTGGGGGNGSISGAGGRGNGRSPSVRRNRSRSRSRPRSLNNNTINGSTASSSFRNRKFLEHLEQKHTMQAALRLKRKSMKVNTTARQRFASRTKNWLANKRNNANRTLSLSANGKLRRTNSLTNIATMKADFIGGNARNSTLRRSNSSTSLAGRLGVRRQPINRRNFLRARSSSIQNLSRTHSQTNLRRINSKSNLTKRMRTNSQNRFNTVKPRNSQPQRFNRSASRQSLNRNNNNIRSRGGRNAIRQRRPSISVNSRLGINRTNYPIQGQTRGRIYTRRNSQYGNTLNQRVGRSRTRNDTQLNNRNRSRSRNSLYRNGNTTTQQRGNNTLGSSGRRGRSRSRGGSRPQQGRSRSRGRSNSRGPASARQQVPSKSKEQLDKELEQYMANSKSSLDHDMDVYMKNSTI